jgi:hypothetical protein
MKETKMSLVPSRQMLLLLSIVVALGSSEATSNAKHFSSAQRLRVRVENASLHPGEVTKVFVEFLDMNYQQVANDATRVIVLGQASPGSRNTGSGYFSSDRITVRPGAWSGETTFSSASPGKLFITASSEGLESGQALVLIRQQKASFLSSLSSFFETVAYAQSDGGFEISPKRVSATADNKHRAKFQISFLQPQPAGTTVRINTNLTAGSILYKGQPVGLSIANIALAEGEDISGEIAIVSANSGKIEISASVRPNGPVDHAEVDFSPPRPAQILFDSDPLSIESHACTVPVSVRLADEGGFPVEPDRERRISFSSALDSDAISFEPSSVVLAPGQRFAQVVFRLKAMPMGNEIKLLATGDQELKAGTKSIILTSLIEKVLVTGPQEVNRGGREAEFIIHLVDKTGNRLAADWNRRIDLSIVGGGLAKTELIIPQGAQQAVVKYTSPDVIGRYHLTAGSSGLQESTHTITVVHPAYWVVLLAVLGGVVGGIARLLHKNCKFEGIVPRWTGECWNLGLVGPIASSLVSGLFFYWALKLGFSQALGSPRLPAGFDLGTNTSVVFFSGLGGFAGTVVLDRLVGWFLPEGKKTSREEKTETIPSTSVTHLSH